MKCRSCGRENPETAIHCGHCRASLHDSIDDRTMDSPGHSGATPGDAKPSFATSDFKDTMLRTPSGHSPSQSHSSDGSGARSRVLEPGDELGPRFQIDERLGEGGMGRVYKATDRDLGRVVAIKVLLSELTSDPQAILRFKHELLLASRISHKNISGERSAKSVQSTGPRPAKCITTDKGGRGTFNLRLISNRSPVNWTAQRT